MAVKDMLELEDTCRRLRRLKTCCDTALLSISHNIMSVHPPPPQLLLGPQNSLGTLYMGCIHSPCPKAIKYSHIFYFYRIGHYFLQEISDNMKENVGKVGRCGK